MKKRNLLAVLILAGYSPRFRALAIDMVLGAYKEYGKLKENLSPLLEKAKDRAQNFVTKADEVYENTKAKALDIVKNVENTMKNSEHKATSGVGNLSNKIRENESHFKET